MKSRPSQPDGKLGVRDHFSTRGTTSSKVVPGGSDGQPCTFAVPPSTDSRNSGGRIGPHDVMRLGALLALTTSTRPPMCCIRKPAHRGGWGLTGASPQRGRPRVLYTPGITGGQLGPGCGHRGPGCWCNGHVTAVMFVCQPSHPGEAYPGAHPRYREVISGGSGV